MSFHVKLLYSSVIQKKYKRRPKEETKLNLKLTCDSYIIPLPASCFFIQGNYYMKKISISSSGIFTIKEYEMEPGEDFISLVRRLCAGPEEVQEIIPYVFEGEDPLGIDARPVSAEEFEKMYPRMREYGPGLAFDVIVRREGHPVTVELTEGSNVIAVNSLDKEAEIDDLLGDFTEDKPGSKAAVTEETAGEPTEVISSLKEDGTPDPSSTACSEELTVQAGAEDDPAGQVPGTEAEDRGAKARTGFGCEEMSPQAFLEILSVAERLKCSTRHCDTSSGRRESVAEHSWRTALMAMLLSGVGEFAGLDMNRVIRMCLIHDLGEAFTGDIPTFHKSADDEDEEFRQLTGWIASFPNAQRREFESLFAEMRERKTCEARLFKALDRIEAVIQHNESDISSWLPLEYDLQFTYGREDANQSAFLKKLRDRIDDWTREKIDASKAEAESDSSHTDSH